MDQEISVHPAAEAVALWTALILLVLLVLSLLVVRQRRNHDVALGDEGIPSLARSIRAFGNAAEYAPAGMAGLLALAAVNAAAPAIHMAGALLFCGRVAHGVGLSRTAGSSLLRSAGMTFTWVAYVFEIVALLIYSIV